jgi:hypothetical protein
MSVTDTRPRRSHSGIRYRWVPSAVRREFDLPPESAPPGRLMRLVYDQRAAFVVVGGINTVVGFGDRRRLLEHCQYVRDADRHQRPGDRAKPAVDEVALVRLRNASPVRVPRAGPRAA